MKEPQRANIVYGILSGFTICYVDDVKFLVREPTAELVYESYDVYNQVLKRHKYDGMLTRDEVLLLLHREKLWTLDGDKNFDEIDKSIDDLKHNLFKTFYGDSKVHQKLRKTIEKVREKQREMYQTRYQFDLFTVEGLAEQIRKYFLYIHTVCDENNELLWPDGDFEEYLLNAIIVAHADTQLDEKEYRELARTNPWSGYWMAYRDSLIPNSNTRLEQLISFSRFYDNIHKSPDCPADEIMQDDDVLDGWIIQQRKDAEEEKKEKNTKPLGVRAGKGDMFIPARSQKDANKIYQHNSPEDRARHRLRSQYIEAQGEVSDLDMPDVKREMAMKAQRQAADRLKGK